MSFVFESEPDDRPSPERADPVLRFTDEAWQMLVLYTLRCQYEIGGLGRLSQDENGDFLVTETILVDQDVNDIATRLDSAALSRLLADDVLAGRDPADLRFWWHSHAHEAPFWSGVDEETIDRFGSDYLVSLVGNHQRRFLARRDDYHPRSTTWVDLEVPDVVIPEDGPISAAVDQNISRWVRHVPRANTARLF